MIEWKRARTVEWGAIVEARTETAILRYRPVASGRYSWCVMRKRPAPRRDFIYEGEAGSPVEARLLCEAVAVGVIDA